nr:hypothetical protein [Thauera linaloolentis]
MRVRQKGWPGDRQPEERTKVAISSAPALVVIGIHREELSFGREVVDGLRAGEVDVLEIPDGLSGRRPRPDQSFRYDMVHEALYLQLLPHMRSHHQLLIDLHTGFDENGPSADLICGDAVLGAHLKTVLARAEPASARIIVLGAPDAVRTHTAIPERIWHNPSFLYLCIEIYLPGDGPAQPGAVALARRLIRLAAGCIAYRGEAAERAP